MIKVVQQYKCQVTRPGWHETRECSLISDYPVSDILSRQYGKRVNTPKLVARYNLTQPPCGSLSSTPRLTVTQHTTVMARTKVF